MQEKLFNRYFILIWFSMLCLMLIQNLMCSGIPLFLPAVASLPPSPVCSACPSPYLVFWPVLPEAI